MDFIGNALRCYEESNDDETMEVEPKLVDCKGNQDVCASSYVKTDMYYIDTDVIATPAGSWKKFCVHKSNPGISKLFVDGASDQCIRGEETKEFKRDFKVRYLLM